MDEVYVNFVEAPPAVGRKTSRWQVRNKFDNSYLGQVQWFGRWRQYCFFPQTNTVFERSCLRVIALFCETESTRYRVANKRKKQDGQRP